MFVNTLDPVLFSIGPIAIHWYGLVYVLGYIALYVFLTRTSLLDRKEADSFVLWLLIGMLLGARIFTFVFYESLTSFWEFFMIWHGGMSFHGALLGMLIAGYWWARKNKKDFWELADASAIIAAFFLVLGRIANFINSEIVGTITDVPWCVEYPLAASPYDTGCRHPVQLYAALKDLFIGCVLLVLRRRKHKPGFIFWSFAFLYGILRFLVNFLRADPALWGWMKWGHVLSLILLIAAGWVLVTRHRNDITTLMKRT